jgi:hypothetical protein
MPRPIAQGLLQAFSAASHHAPIERVDCLCTDLEAAYDTMSRPE